MCDPVTGGGFSQQKPSSTTQSCEGWNLCIKVVSDTENLRPNNTIKISIGEMENFLGTTLFRYTKFGGTKNPTSKKYETPADYVLSGKTESTFYLKAKDENEDWITPSKKIVKVVLKPGDKRTVDLAIEARWNAFHLVNNANGKQIEKAKVKVSLPGEKNDTIKPADPGGSPSQEKQEIALFPITGKSKISEITHDEVWEFVEIGGV